MRRMLLPDLAALALSRVASQALFRPDATILIGRFVRCLNETASSLRRGIEHQSRAADKSYFDHLRSRRSTSPHLIPRRHLSRVPRGRP
jgi:hypothetical protein